MEINNYYNNKMSDILSLPSDNIIYTDNKGTSGRARQWLVNDLIKVNNAYIRDRQAKLNKWTDIYFALYTATIAENNAKKDKKRTLTKKSVTIKVA